MLLLAHFSPCRSEKGSHWHLVLRSLSLIRLYALKQDLKDLMRKAGEVTFVDAHRPNKNEGYVLLSVRTSPTVSALRVWS